MMPLPEYEQTAAHGDARQIHAANLSTVDEATASPEVRHLYERFRQEFGRPQVPGILQCFATHPPLLEHMMGLAKEMLFVDGALGRQNKELISAFVSASNRCEYCADSHAYSFRMQGRTERAAAALLACHFASDALTPKQRTLLQFAKKITESSQAITPEDIEIMRAEGWSDLQIAETIHVRALFATFNRVVNAFGLPHSSYCRPSHRRWRMLGEQEPFSVRCEDENSFGYAGWGVAAAAFAGVMTSFSPIVPYTFSLFLNPLHAAFGWRRAAMDGTFAIAAITVALVSPFIGMLLDRFPPRRVILPSVAVLAQPTPQPLRTPD